MSDTVYGNKKYLKSNLSSFEGNKFFVYIKMEKWKKACLEIPLGVGLDWNLKQNFFGRWYHQFLPINNKGMSVSAYIFDQLSLDLIKCVPQVPLPNSHVN